MKSKNPVPLTKSKSVSTAKKTKQLASIERQFENSIEHQFETYVELENFLLREVRKLKKCLANVSGPEHNAYYDLKEGLEKFFANVDKRYGK